MANSLRVYEFWSLGAKCKVFRQLLKGGEAKKAAGPETVTTAFSRIDAALS
ncbi:hypothetical protein D3C85_1916580 [compost metagenome]